MSQKIVIKANVKRELQESVPTVSYEWNWRRIVSIAMLVLMTSAALVVTLKTRQALKLPMLSLNHQ